MIYLSEFYFPSQNSEANYLAESPRAKMTCYDSFYPFGLFAGRGLKALDLADVISSRIMFPCASSTPCTPSRRAA